MKWQESYKNKLVKAEEAVTYIKSGNRVVVGHAAGEPLVLIKAMVDNKENYRDVEIVNMVVLGKGEYSKPGMEKYFHNNSIFASACTREAIESGRGDFTPCFFYEVPKLFRKGYIPIDVARCFCLLEV